MSKKPISDFPGYFVDDIGLVWSKVWARNQSDSPHAEGIKPLRSFEHRGTGYRFVWLRRDNKSYKRYVHRLVLFSHVGPPPPNCETRHLNGIRSDNKLKNLCWGTHQENMEDRRRHGTDGSGKPAPWHQGERHPMAKITEVEALVILEKRKGGRTYESLAEEYNVTAGAISNLCRGKSWKHLHKGKKK